MFLHCFAERGVLILGLDNAGKTTILYRLHLKDITDVIATTPTVGSNVEEFKHRSVKLQVWDLGGQQKLRSTWSAYYVGAHAVVTGVAVGSGGHRHAFEAAERCR